VAVGQLRTVVVDCADPAPLAAFWAAVLGAEVAHAGDEWVSLSQSFLMAGARNVLATLWPVEDRSTAELMKSFYEELAAGADVDVALARAQRKAIRNSRWPQPFHWAAFVLVGGP